MDAEANLFKLFMCFCVFALLFWQMNFVLLGFIFLFLAVDVDVRPRKHYG
jgi:hypothetical protein